MASHPDRSAQFEHVNAKAVEFLQRSEPVVSADAKRRVGELKNAGAAELQGLGMQRRSPRTILAPRDTAIPVIDPAVE